MRRTSRDRAVSVALAALCALTWAACGPQRDVAPLVDGEYPMGPLEFAGVDGLYAVRRIAAEAKVLIVIDEYRHRNAQRLDLGFIRVDMDFEAGALGPVLAQLHEHTNGAFDYHVEDGVLFVRSRRSESEQDILDAPILPAGQLEVNFSELIAWIQTIEPNSYVAVGDVMGQPALSKIKIDVADRSSIKDVLIQYARALDRGLHIYRAGYEYVPGQPEHLVSNAIGLLGPLLRAEALPDYRQRGSVVYVLSGVADRSGATICILDRTYMNDGRGSLDFGGALDRGWPLDEAVKRLARFGSKSKDVKPIYSWELDDDLYLVRTKHFKYFLTGHDLLLQKLKGGTFEGTLGHLARWLNANRMEPSEKVFVAGEIMPDWKRVTLEIQEGSTIQEVLLRFARVSGEGWNVVIKDSPTPVAPLDGTWSGAFLTRLVDWGPKGWES